MISKSNDRFFLLLASLLCFLIHELQAQSENPPKLYAIKGVASPDLDGKLDESFWQNAALVNRFIQREPEEGSMVSESTLVYIYYDEDNIYFGFDCRDQEAEKIIATEMRRDSYLLNNDCIEIYLDTYHDHRTAFYFSTNALGARRDGIIQAELNDQTQNWDWNGIWDVESHIDDRGWTAEVVIPFKTLRFSPGRNRTWGLNIARYIPRKREEAFWAPIKRELGFWGHYRVSAYGHLEGTDILRQPGKWEIKPFSVAGVQQDFTIENEYDTKLDIGLDFRYQLTPNITATLTINTDFAQVEADQEQVNLSRFELFFPEKREFFLEGATIFNFGERSHIPLTPASILFFSRRIGLSDDNEMIPLLGGVKITGKEGPLNIGFLNILANRASYINDDDEPVHIPRTNYSAARLNLDLFSNSSLGIIGLNKQNIDHFGYVRNLGMDGNIYLNDNTQVGGFLSKSFEPFVSDKDYAGYFDFLYMDDFFSLFFSQNSIQKNFNADMGFFPRTDIRKTQINTWISPRPDLFDIRQIFLIYDFSYITDQQGMLASRINYSGFFSLFENGSNLLALYGQNYERLTEEFEISDDIIIPEAIYRYDNILIEYQSDRSKPLAGKIRFNGGDLFHGTLIGYGADAYLKLGRHLTAELKADYNTIHLPEGTFTTTLVGARIIYSFHPDLFIKPYIQWNSDTDKIISNVLFNFHYIPGSDLYIVYNEEFDLSNPFTRTENRTVLLKFTYLFNF
jgi:hypothetical protein